MKVLGGRRSHFIQFRQKEGLRGAAQERNRSSECRLAAVGHVQEAVLVLVLLVQARHEHACMYPPKATTVTNRDTAQTKRLVGFQNPFLPFAGCVPCTNRKMPFSAGTLMRFRMTNMNCPTVRSCGTKNCSTHAKSSALLEPHIGTQLRASPHLFLVDVRHIGTIGLLANDLHRTSCQPLLPKQPTQPQQAQYRDAIRVLGPDPLALSLALLCCFPRVDKAREPKPAKKQRTNELRVRTRPQARTTRNLVHI